MRKWGLARGGGAPVAAQLDQGVPLTRKTNGI
jgi:hypothetical protein